MSLLRPLLAAVIAASMVLAHGEARADATPEDRAAAESLFREGRRLMEEGRLADACRKLGESQRLDPAPGTLINLALCHEQEGRLATAWGEFSQAVNAAKRDGRADRESLSRSHATALEARLPRLLIDVQAEARVPGLEIVRNGSALQEGAWGASLPVDPGEVTVEARAAGYKPWRATVTANEGEAQRVDVARLELEPKAAPAAATATTTPTPASGPGSADPAPAKGGWSSNQTIGVIVGGVGLASLAVGTGFGIDAASKVSASNGECPSQGGVEHCSPEGVRLNDAAKTSATVANVTIAAGAAAVLVSGYFLFFAPRGGDAPAAGGTARPSAPRVSVAPVPFAGGAGALLHGSF